MKKYIVLLFLACGTVADTTLNPEPAPAPAPAPAPELTMEMMPIGVIRQAASVDPCTLVFGKQHMGVLFTALKIDNTDPKCPTPPVGHYSVEGSTTTDPDGALPLFNNRCGCCAATLTPAMRVGLDGGMEAVCHLTSSCQVCFNGGNSQMSCDLWFNEEGTFTGTQEQVSTGQLCPYVKVGLNNTGAPAKWDGGR